MVPFIPNCRAALMASLRELLEEQQEQFLPHLENGHSERNLKSYARILRRALYRIVHWKIIKRAPENGRWKLFGSEALAMKLDGLSCSGILSASHREAQRRDREEHDQLSPVSVFALHSDDDSAVCSHSAAEDSELEELLEDKREWHQRNNVVFQFLEVLEGRICDPNQVIRLVGEDFLSSSREWSNYQDEMQEIGREMEGVIFEEIRDEVVEDMMDYH